jgi:ABC-type uncharacterized transport system permease subunit
MFKAHLILSIVAYGLLSVSLIHALLMSYLEKNLHRHKISPLIDNLPPLLKLENLLFTIALLGFAVLTAALLSGFFVSFAIQSTIIPWKRNLINRSRLWNTSPFKHSSHYF